MSKPTVTEKQKDKQNLASFHKWNLWLAGIYAIQGVAILLLSATRLYPVTTSYLTPDPVASELAGESVLATATRQLFDVDLVHIVAAFLLIAALGHALAASVYRGQYESGLKRKVNRLRWLESGLSAGVMLTAVAVLSGVTDLSLLIAVLASKIIADLALLALDTYNQSKTKPSRFAVAAGGIAALIPWVVLAIYAWASNAYGNGGMPMFVYGVFATSLILFGAMGVNMYLQYKKTGKWKDYLYGERAFIVLGFAVNTLVAWQIFAGALRP